jgi:hypothetical protein
MLPPKHGFKRRCGIGERALEKYVDMAIHQGFPTVVINQTGYVLAGVRERRLEVLYLHRTEQRKNQ